MSTAGGFTVAPAALVTHAEHVRGAAGSLGQAAAAGETVRAQPEAYGKICAFVPAILDPFQTLATETLRSCELVLGSAADALEATADTYTRLESETQDRIAGVSGQLDGPS